VSSSALTSAHYHLLDLRTRPVLYNVWQIQIARGSVWRSPAITSFYLHIKSNHFCLKRSTLTSFVVKWILFRRLKQKHYTPNVITSNNVVFKNLNHKDLEACFRKFTEYRLVVEIIQ
jgi:hypothetical protein